MHANEEKRWTGGGTWKPEGGLGYWNATWPLVKLVLDAGGATLVTPFGSDIPFRWHEVKRVERIKGLLPWDHGVRFVLSRGPGGEKLNFFTLTRSRAEEILSLAESRGAAVDRNKHRALLF